MYLAPVFKAILYSRPVRNTIAVIKGLFTSAAHVPTAPSGKLRHWMFALTMLVAAYLGGAITFSAGVLSLDLSAVVSLLPSGWHWPVITPFNPPPIAEAGFRVLVLEETAERSKLPKDQLTILTSTVVRTRLKARCVKTADGTPEFRFLDKDTDLANESEIWKKAVERAKTDSKGVMPWMLLSNGKTGLSGPLSANGAELLELVGKYGGE